MVKGLEFIAIEERIVEVIGFPAKGVPYPTFKDARSAREEFTKLSDPLLVVDMQGTRRTSLPKKWKQVAIYITKYISCEGC